MIAIKLPIHRARFVLLSAGVFFSMFAFSEEGAVAGANDVREKPVLEQRDPFWPVGYQPEVKGVIPEKMVEKVVEPSGNHNWREAMKMVSISGVSSRADEFFAVVNGKVKRVSDTISVSHEGITYTWAVDSIKPPGSVKLRRVSAF